MNNSLHSRFIAQCARTCASHLLPLLLLLALPAVVQAQFDFTTNSGSILITKYTGPGGNVTIPSTTNGLPVTGIGEYAFGYCTNLTSVTIGSGVTSIGSWAFYHCTSLTNITIPNSVSTLGSATFGYCSSLTSVMIPDSVISIAQQAFFDCSSLTEVCFVGNAPSLGGSQASAYVFAYANNVTVYYLPGTTGWDATFGGRPTAPARAPNITAQPQSVATYVGETVSFRVLADGLGPITYQWWKETTDLTGATNMGFTITNVQLADAGNYTVVVTGFGAATTSQVATLKVQAMPPNDLTYTTNSSGLGISITGYTGNDQVVVLPHRIFGLPVTRIEDSAFRNCAGLTSLTIPDSVTSIGFFAFEYCGSLISVTIPDSVISIGDSAFNNCTNLSSITIPDRATSIGTGTFQGCISLSSVAIPNSITNLGDAAFNGCAGLVSVTLGNGVTRIGNSTFWGCTSLTSVAIPNSVMSIGDSALSGCATLRSVTIPGSVATIGQETFFYCTNLEGIYFGGDSPSFGGASLFDGDNHVTVYYLPGTTGWGAMYAGRPTTPWNLAMLTTISSFGVRTDSFGLTIKGANGLTVVVEASTNPANATWLPVSTNTLAGGSSNFSDPDWTNFPTRVYRVRWP